MKTKLFCSLLFLMFILTSVKSQDISMFQGFWSYKYYEGDKKISKKQVENLLIKDAEAHNSWKKSKKHVAYAWTAVGVQYALGAWGLIRASNDDNAVLPLVGSLGAGGVAIAFSLSSTNLKKEAIIKYNNNELGSLRIGPTHNGAGLVLSF